MSRRKINTKDLLLKIDARIKEKMASEEVVSLNEFRSLREQKQAQTILVVDDDETMRSSMRRIFENAGFQVKTASDGSQLTSVLDDTPIDLIVLDVGLPWMNGLELAEMMRAHEDLKSIPLIFVSGQTSDEDIKKGFQAGADDYIKKPFDVERILKTVRTLLKIN